MRKALCILLLLLFASFQLIGLSVERTGYGETEAEARADAAAELSKYLYMSVDSRTVSTLLDDGQSNVGSYFSGTEISSQMPLLGVTYTDALEWEYFVSTAHMESSVSLPMYYEALDATIDSLVMPDLTGVSSINAVKLLNEILEGLEEYRKLTYVTAALGGVYLKKPSVTEGEIKSLLAKMIGTIDSLEKAAQVLTRDCSYSGVYVEQPLPVTDNVASDFSAVFSNALSGALSGKTTTNMQTARYFLSTRYSEDQGGNLFVTASLNDTSGNSKYSASVTIPAHLIAGMNLYADGYDFRKALKTGESVDSSFNVYIRVNGGNVGNTFHRGDEVYLEVKATQPCYYYIVGYVFDETNSKFAYLFPISFYEEGKDMFIGRISSENVGKWIVINPVVDGEMIPFEIMPPYGVETYQVYASTTNDHAEFASRIPTWIDTEDFYLISGNPQQALSATRALNVKKAATASKTTSNSEASVTYRSVAF